MKKRVMVWILVALLIMFLVACGGEQASDLEDYETLMREMSGLREYLFHGDMTLSLAPDFLGDAAFLFTDLMPMRFSLGGTASHTNREMRLTHQYLYPDGSPMFDMEMILQGGLLYVGLPSMLYYILSPVFEALGLELSLASMEDLLGGHRHLAVPYDEALADILFAPMQVTGGMDIEPFLSRQGEAFTILISGEDVRQFADDMGELLGLFIIDGGMATGADEIGDVLAEAGAQIATADLTDASFLEVISRRDDSFYQTIEIQVPGILDVQANFIFTAQPIQPVLSPENALTERELAELLLRLDLSALIGGTRPDNMIPGEEIAIVYDLTTLNLLAHNLDEESRLEIVAMNDGRGGTYRVSVVAGSATAGGTDYIFCDAEAIEMHYTIQTGLNAVESILLAVEEDRAGYFLLGSQLSFSALRTYEGRHVAMLAIAEQTVAGLTRVSVYMGQVANEGGGVVRLVLALYLDLFTETDYEILSELSRHIGIDLGAAVTAVLSAE